MRNLLCLVGLHRFTHAFERRDVHMKMEVLTLYYPSHFKVCGRCGLTREVPEAEAERNFTVVLPPTTTKTEGNKDGNRQEDTGWGTSYYRQSREAERQNELNRQRYEQVWRARNGG